MRAIAPIRLSQGWSLIELLLVIVIIGLLGTLAVPMYGYFMAKGRYAACVSHLRNLHVCFGNYMLDNDMVWPQPPPGKLDNINDESEEWEWWHETLKPYGSAKHYWLCPEDADSQEQMHSETDDYASSYIPTLFEAVPNTAYTWSNQPWLIERGQLHGKDQGPNILMPDGTIRQGPNFYAQ